jgi:hypothetical protein
MNTARGSLKLMQPFLAALRDFEAKPVQAAL